MADKKRHTLYDRLIEAVFKKVFRSGVKVLPFVRDDIERAASRLGLPRPKNLGDVIYAYRYRTDPPPAILRRTPSGEHWTIVGAGKAKYEFRLVHTRRTEPRADLAVVKVPDATPEIVGAYSLSDEQALLAKVRYNRLVDIFLGVAAYSLQNHLRTSVGGMGQIEIDELYVGVDRRGAHFVIPVQAKAASDRLGTVQTEQDLTYCAAQFPNLICRPVSAQVMVDGSICMFEMTRDGGEIKVSSEKHYRLVPADAIAADDLKRYATDAG
jgi:hypothetical protein